jgi:hypothetical protein
MVYGPSASEVVSHEVGPMLVWGTVESVGAPTPDPPASVAAAEIGTFPVTYVPAGAVIVTAGAVVSTST